MMAMGDSSDAEEARSEAYDDGYLHGVQDARANPALADENVQDIINDRADEHFEALDETTASIRQSTRSSTATALPTPADARGNARIRGRSVSSLG
jgi:hypothetical protein